MKGIHDIFSANDNYEEDPVSLKNPKKLEKMWEVHTDILGFTFDGGDKTICIEAPKIDALLTVVKVWIHASNCGSASIPFTESCSVITKMRHSFIPTPRGKGLLSPCNYILQKQQDFVFLHWNDLLLTALIDCRTFLRESRIAPTKCTDLVSGWP